MSKNRSGPWRPGETMGSSKGSSFPSSPSSMTGAWGTALLADLLPIPLGPRPEADSQAAAEEVPRPC